MLIFRYDKHMQTLRRSRTVKPLKDTSTIAELIERLKHLDISPITQVYFDIRTESFLKSSFKQKKITTKVSWKDLPVSGMWSERDDMQDPSGHVRELRKPRYKC